MVGVAAIVVGVVAIESSSFSLSFSSSSLEKDACFSILERGE